MGLLAIVVLLVLFRTRLRASQDRFTQELEPGQPANFWHDLAAFAISLLLSARWPALVLAIGWRLKVASEASTWSESVGNALITSVAFLWGCELIREFCRADGVGERVFEWPARATQAVRSKLEPVLVAGTPLITLLHLTHHGDVDQMQGLQRVLFVTIMALLGIQLAQLTRPHGILMTSLGESSGNSFIARGRYLIWMAAAGVPLAFVGLSVSGYHFSAYQLSGHLAETGMALVAIIMVYSLSLAWLKDLARNRQLHDEATQELNLSAETNLSIETDALDSINEDEDLDAVSRAPKPQTSTEKVNQEVGDLLRYACIFLMVVGGWFIWSEVFPALRVLDSFVLWQNIEPVAETFVDSTGKDAIRVVDHHVPTTLTDLMVAVLICMATWLIGRRLPGVVELALFSKLPFEHGGRQALGHHDRLLGHGGWIHPGLQCDSSLMEQRAVVGCGDDRGARFRIAGDLRQSG